MVYTTISSVLLAAIFGLPQVPGGPPQVPTIADSAYSCDTDAARALGKEFARDASVAEVGCDSAATELLAKFAEVARSGTGAFRLKKTCTTVEGDPIVHYLVADGGEITLVTDSTADKFGPKQVCRARVAHVALGYLEPAGADGAEPRFVAATNAPAGTRLVLRCFPQEWDF